MQVFSFGPSMWTNRVLEHLVLEHRVKYLNRHIRVLSPDQKKKSAQKKIEYDKINIINLLLNTINKFTTVEEKNDLS